MVREANAREDLGGPPQLISGTTGSAFEEHQDHQRLGGLQQIVPPSTMADDFNHELDGYKGASSPYSSPTTESWPSSASTAYSVPRTSTLDAVSLEYQTRYLIEQMAKLHPLDRNVWYRQDHYTTSSPAQASKEAIPSSNSSNSESPTISHTPAVHITAPSQSTTPKPVEHQPPNSDRPRRKSEVGSDRVSKGIDLRARAQSVGARPKGVRFADDPLASSSDTTEPNTMPGTTSDPLFVAKSIWGVLYRDGKATTRWKRFLSDIAGDLAPGGYLGPSAMRKFYLDFERTKERIPFQDIFLVANQRDLAKIRALYSDLGLNPRDVQTRGQNTPYLSPEGFAKWMIYQISAHPHHETKRLNDMVKEEIFRSGVHSLTEERQLLPSILPPSLIPVKEVGNPKAAEKMKVLVDRFWPMLNSPSLRTPRGNPGPVFVVQPPFGENDLPHRNRESRYSGERLFVEVPRPSRSHREREREPQYYQGRRRHERYYRDARPANTSHGDSDVSPDRRGRGYFNRTRHGEEIVAQDPLTGRYYTQYIATRRPDSRERRYSSRDDRQREYVGRRSDHTRPSYSRVPDGPVEYHPLSPESDRARYRGDRRDSEDDWASSPSGSSISGNHFPRDYYGEPTWADWGRR